VVDRFVGGAVKLSRNPLGIIALAFVLVYGVAGFVATSDVFSATERQFLIGFLLIFPVLILAIFYRLVTKHHGKLYAPADFRDDNAFLRALDQRISESPKVLELEAFTEEIKRQVDGQPLYKYTKLSECGKQLILGLSMQEGRLNIPEYNEKRQFSASEIDSQTEKLHAFGWVTRNGDELTMTPQGRQETDTFIDLAWGRMK
jgi:hypothetical protein